MIHNMAARRIGSMWLYLAIACFLGIVSIFFGDGYMGIYDSVRVTTGDITCEIEPDYWEYPRGKEDGYHIYEVTLGDLMEFRYQIDNRRFFDYSLDVEVSLWEGGREVRELFTASKKVRMFTSSPVYEWTLDTAELDVSEEYGGTNYVVKINRDGVERKIRFRISQSNLSKYPPVIALPPR